MQPVSSRTRVIRSWSAGTFCAITRAIAVVASPSRSTSLSLPCAGNRFSLSSSLLPPSLASATYCLPSARNTQRSSSLGAGAATTTTSRAAFAADAVGSCASGGAEIPIACAADSGNDAIVIAAASEPTMPSAMLVAISGV
jgi:hypothetical protein